MLYHRPGDWAYDVDRYHYYLSLLEGASRVKQRQELLDVLVRIFSYWETRFYYRRLFLNNNQVIPGGPETQVADSIAPSGEIDEYFEFTPLQLLELFA